jgi:hypothetical protein
MLKRRFLGWTREAFVAHRQAMRDPAVWLMAIATLYYGGASDASQQAAPPMRAEQIKPAEVAPRAEPTLSYRNAGAHTLARELFRTQSMQPITITVSDMLVATGQASEKRRLSAAALLEVQGGSARLIVDKQTHQVKPGTVIGINQGQLLVIDNRKGKRPFAARLIEFSGAQ